MFEVDDLIGRTCLMQENEKGEIHRARIAELIEEHDHATQRNKEHIKFRCSVNNEQYEEILTYNELLDHLNKDAEDDHPLWKFRRIISHQHSPYKPSDPESIVDPSTTLCLNGRTGSEESNPSRSLTRMIQSPWRLRRRDMQGRRHDLWSVDLLAHVFRNLPAQKQAQKQPSK